MRGWGDRGRGSAAALPKNPHSHCFSCPHRARSLLARPIFTPPYPPSHHFGYSAEGDYTILDKVSLGATRTPTRGGGGWCVLRHGSGWQSCLHRGWHFLLPLSAAVPAVATGRARARACARGPALSGFAARSSPLRLTAALRPAQPPNPSSSDAARHARPNRARLLQPRHAQLRVERALALAHAARPSQGLRPAARLSARRQRTVLHSPLNPSASAAARHAQGRSALFFILF